MASSTEIKVLVLDRLSTLYEPFQPKVIGGQMNPHYPAYVAEYLATLSSYSVASLRLGMDQVVHDWKTTKAWPTPAFIAERCLAEERERRPIERPAPQLPSPVFSAEHRTAMAEKLGRITHAMAHGHADGTPYGRDEAKDRAWVYQGIAAKGDAA